MTKYTVSTEVRVNVYNRLSTRILTKYSRVSTHDITYALGVYGNNWEGAHLCVNRIEDDLNHSKVKNISQVILITPRGIQNNVITLSWYGLFFHPKSGFSRCDKPFRDAFTQALFEDINVALSSLGLPEISLNPNEKIEKSNLFDLPFDYSRRNIDDSIDTVIKVAEVCNSVYVNKGYRSFLIDHIHNTL
jgi:hypothetical protein